MRDSEVNRERVEKWAAELESGGHPQVCGHLRRTLSGEVIGHCALGIALLVAERHGVQISAEGWALGTLPEHVRVWYGFPSSAVPIVQVNDDGESGLTDVPYLNDALENFQSIVDQVPEEHNNFWQIAQAIRATYLKDEGS